MKIIYTYKHTEGWDKGLDNEKAIYILRKSVEQANRWYETEMYCDSKGREEIINLDIPFTRIVVLKELEDYTSPNWGMMKLISIKKQSKAHIHIDMDTIILKPIEFDSTMDMMWGNAEVSMLYGKGHYSSLKYIYNHYLKTAEQYESKRVNDGFFDFSHAPNNSLLIINNPTKVNYIIQELEQIIKPYCNVKSGNLNMFMEQFMLMNLFRERGGLIGYLPRKGEFHISDYYRDLILNNEIPFSDYEENGWLHFEHLNKYSLNEIIKILNNIK